MLLYQNNRSRKALAGNVTCTAPAASALPVPTHPQYRAPAAQSPRDAADAGWPAAGHSQRKGAKTQRLCLVEVVTARMRGVRYSNACLRWFGSLLHPEPDDTAPAPPAVQVRTGVEGHTQPPSARSALGKRKPLRLCVFALRMPHHRPTAWSPRPARVGSWERGIGGVWARVKHSLLVVSSSYISGECFTATMVWGAVISGECFTDTMVFGDGHISGECCTATLTVKRAPLRSPCVHFRESVVYFVQAPTSLLLRHNLP